MKIVMIGDSAVGKTTFMMSTYGLMREGAIEGFRVQCKNQQADRKLMRAYNDFRSEGVYPPATVQMSSYDYDFYSDNEWVMNFSLTDIRGESIHDYDVNDLSRELRRADAMMLFLNGYDILNGKDVSEQIDDIYILMNNCFASDDRSKILMVIFAQMDRIGQLSGEHLEILNNTVQELKEITDRNDNIFYQMIPTACSLDCMMDLDFAMVTLMLFGYNGDVLRRRRELEDELRSIQQQYGSGIGREVKEFLLETFWQDKERRQARSRYAELEKQIPIYEQMVEKFNRLYKFVDDYEIGTFYRLKRRWTSRQEDPFCL